LSKIQEKAMLILSQGSQGGRRWLLGEQSLLIGRDPTCDIVLPDRVVSRRHARIFLQDGRYHLEDLHSKNGTFRNGEPVFAPTRLADGDEIQIAMRFKLAFVGAEETEPLALENRSAVSPGLRVSVAERTVWINGREVNPPLSPAQFRFLSFLWQQGGNVVSRDAIVEAVWPEDSKAGVTEQAIDALVRRLRERLGEYDEEHHYIVTVRGHGFRLENI